jgi:hypothetical protein
MRLFLCIGGSVRADSGTDGHGKTEKHSAFCGRAVEYRTATGLSHTIIPTITGTPRLKRSLAIAHSAATMVFPGCLRWLWLRQFRNLVV